LGSIWWDFITGAAIVLALKVVLIENSKLHRFGSISFLKTCMQMKFTLLQI
jgi:hypothetical protein